MVTSSGVGVTIPEIYRVPAPVIERTLRRLRQPRWNRRRRIWEPTWVDVPVYEMAVALINTNGANADVASPTSNNKTCTTGTNRFAVVPIGYDGAAGMSVTGVTIGGSAASSLGTAANNATGQEYVEVWGLVAYPTGTQTVAITVSGTITDIYSDLVTFSGVHQTTPVRTGTYQTGASSGTSASLTITSDPADLTFSAIDAQNGTTSSNQTSNGITNAGGRSFGSDRATTAASSVTHTWTIASGAYAMVGFSIQDVNASGGASSPFPPFFPQQQTVWNM